MAGGHIATGMADHSSHGAKRVAPCLLLFMLLALHNFQPDSSALVLPDPSAVHGRMLVSLVTQVAHTAPACAGAGAVRAGWARWRWRRWRTRARTSWPRSSVRSCWSWAWRPASGARLFWLTSLSQTCLRAKIMRAAMIAPKLAVDRQSVRSLPVISARGSMPVAGVTCHKD